MLQKFSVPLATLVVTLTLAISGQALAISGPANLTPGQRAAELCHNMTTTMGVVSHHTQDADGKLDGFVLDQGAVVHFVPQPDAQIGLLAPVGANVKVIGLPFSDTTGEKRLEAETIMNVDTNASLKLSTNTLSTPEIASDDRDRIEPSEVPGETDDALPDNTTEPLDGAIILPEDNPPVPSLRTPVRPGDRVIEPSMAPPPPPSDRLTVPPAGAPILPNARPVAPTGGASVSEAMPPDAIE